MQRSELLQGATPFPLTLHFYRHLKGHTKCFTNQADFITKLAGCLDPQHSCQNGPLLTTAAKNLRLARAPLHTDLLGSQHPSVLIAFPLSSLCWLGWACCAWGPIGSVLWLLVLFLQGRHPQKGELWSRREACHHPCHSRRDV